MTDNPFPVLFKIFLYQGMSAFLIQKLAKNFFTRKKQQLDFSEVSIFMTIFQLLKPSVLSDLQQ